MEETEERVRRTVSLCRYEWEVLPKKLGLNRSTDKVEKVGMEFQLFLPGLKVEIKVKVKDQTSFWPLEPFSTSTSKSWAVTSKQDISELLNP